jgi:hypothetical protein
VESPPLIPPGQKAINNAEESTPKNGPKFTTPCPIIPVEIVAPTPAKPSS